MRAFTAQVLTLAIACCVFGQTYTIDTFAGGGQPVAGGGNGDNGPASSAFLQNPQGVVVDTAGNLYIADYLNQRVRKVSNGIIATVAGNGTEGDTGDNGLATSAQLDGPRGVALDSAGNLYIAGHSSVRKVSNGVIATVFAEFCSSDPFHSPGVGCLSIFEGVAVDAAGNLYIADPGNNITLRVSNGAVTTMAGGFGVAVDAAGDLYIADANLNSILKMSNGVITIVAGNGETSCPAVGPPDSCFSGDNGPATNAQLYDPSGVAVDSAGNLYIADTGNDRIRKVSNGIITTVAGNGSQGFSGDNGPATNAQLNDPVGAAVDAAGNVYIADSGNDRIRALIPSGASCSASVTPLTLSHPAPGGNVTVTLQTGLFCAWAIQSLPRWITYSGNAVGTGPGSITLNVAANRGTARTATISIAGIPVSVTQPGSAGRPVWQPRPRGPSR